MQVKWDLREKVQISQCYLPGLFYKIMQLTILHQNRTISFFKKKEQVFRETHPCLSRRLMCVHFEKKQGHEKNSFQIKLGMISTRKSLKNTHSVSSKSPCRIGNLQSDGASERELPQTPVQKSSIQELKDLGQRAGSIKSNVEK